MKARIAAIAPWWPGILIAALAALLRFQNIDWGLPDCYEEAFSLRIAWGFWNWGGGGFDWNPHFFNYPSLYFYLQFGVQAVLRAAGAISGSMPDADAFRIAYETDPGRFILAGRSLSALLGAATVFLLYLAARVVGGKRLAVCASLFLVFHSVHLEKSRFLEVDVPATFFATLSLYFLVRYMERRRNFDLVAAGAAVGLAASTKYPGALMMVNLPLAVWFAGRPFRVKTLVCAAATAALFFVLGSPFILFDFAAFLKDFGFESYHMKVGHSGSAGGGPGGALSIFSGGFGPALFAAAVAGLILAIYRFEKRYLLFVTAPLLFFLFLAVSRVQVPHYPLPAVPSLALLAAFALIRLTVGMAPRRQWIVPVAMVLLLLRPAWQGFSHTARLGAGDSRTAARLWIEGNVREGALILMEPHGPQLQSVARLDEYREDRRYRSIGAKLLAASRRPAYHVAVLPTYSVEMQRSARYYHRELYPWFDLFVLSSSVKNRYRAEPEAYPVQNEFYDDLEHGGELVRSFSPGGGTGPVIEVYRRTAAPPPSPRITLDPAGARSEPFLDFMRGVAASYDKTGRSAPAMALYRALLELQPNDAETLAEVGTMLGEREGIEAGLPLLRRSVELDPTNPTARMNLAVLLCQANRFTEGIPLLEDLLREDPANAELHGNLGSAYLSMGRTDRAMDHFRRFLQLAPNHPNAGQIRELLRRQLN